MGIGGSFRLTVQERIIIHLSEYSKYVDNIEVPFDLTQEGIAQSIGVVRSAIPRAIKKLISNNYVKEILAHVTGVSRRRKVYHLTTNGLIMAIGSKDKLSNLEIQLVTDKKKLIKCKIKDVPDKLGKDKGLKILDVLLNLDSENRFDFEQYKQLKAKPLIDNEKPDKTGPSHESLNHEQTTSISGKAQNTGLLEVKPISHPLKIGQQQTIKNIHFIEKAPKIEYFIGRKKEIENIKQCLSDKDYRIVVVHGIAGIGKTTLAGKLLEELNNNYNLFWYRFHEWDTLRNILNSISKFLQLFARNKLINYLESNQNIDLNDVSELLEHEFRDLKALLFLDDFHKVNEQVIGLFTLFREMLERLTENDVKCVVLSRSFVPFYDRRDVLVKRLISEIELTGLNEEESRELLKYRNIELGNFHQLYQMTKGHPLSLELLEPDSELMKQKNIKMYLEEEVLNRLSLREKSLLKLASIYRYPIPADGFFINEKAQISRETLSILTRKTLIKESIEGYEVHDLIKDFFYSYLTTPERMSYHRMAGQFYIGRLKMINDLLKRNISNVIRPDAFNHCMNKSQMSKLTKSVPTIEPLLEQRFRGILETQFHFLMAEDHNRAAEVAIIMGHELLNLTYVEELINNLEKIDLNQVSNEYKMDLDILKADALTVSGNLNEAQRLYEDSLVIAEEEANKTKLAEIYCKLGAIKEKLNHYKSAIELLNKSLEISKKIGDSKSISDAYGSLGDVYWKMTKYDKSNEYYNKCLESAETITDLPGKAKTFLSLGIQSAKHGQLEESLKYYERCLDILEKGKGLNGINYSNFYEHLGDHYLKTIFSYFIQNSGKVK